MNPNLTYGQRELNNYIGCEQMTSVSCARPATGVPMPFIPQKIYMVKTGIISYHCNIRIIHIL